MEAPACRICYESISAYDADDARLTEVCLCTEPVHLSCLGKWHAFSKQSNSCEICRANYVFNDPVELARRRFYHSLICKGFKYAIGVHDSADMHITLFVMQDAFDFHANNKEIDSETMAKFADIVADMSAKAPKPIYWTQFRAKGTVMTSVIHYRTAGVVEEPGKRARVEA